MKPTSGIVAYIDGANLYQGIKSLGWKLDYGRFRIWLSDKYGVDRAYIFIGLIAKYSELYKSLQEAGFTLIFKEIIYDGDGKAKGNCDADLVTQAMRDSYEGRVTQTVLVASDGDYAPLVKFWIEKSLLKTVLSPAPSEKCSVLLKRTGAHISYLHDQRRILEIRSK